MCGNNFLILDRIKPLNPEVFYTSGFLQRSGVGEEVQPEKDKMDSTDQPPAKRQKVSEVMVQDRFGPINNTQRASYSLVAQLTMFNPYLPQVYRFFSDPETNADYNFDGDNNLNCSVRPF